MPAAPTTHLERVADDLVARIRCGVDAWPDPDFEAAALRLFRAQYDAVPVYRAWCDHELAQRQQHGPEHVETWRDIPALPIAAFRTLRVAGHGPGTTRPMEVDAAEWVSSGTTGGSRSHHHLVSLDAYDAALDGGFRAALLPDVAAGRTPPLACIQLQPDGAAAPHSSLSHMFDRIRTGDLCLDRGSWVDGEYRLDPQGAWRELARCCSESTPVLLLATSFALVQLLDATADGPPLQLPPGSRIVDTGGTKGRTREVTRDDLLNLIHQRLGTASEWCENEYGMSELSSQAWLGTVAASAGHGLPAGVPGPASMRWTPPWLRVRVVDPLHLHEVENGEAGLLVFHDLANCWSSGAVRSEDLGIRLGGGFDILGRAPGAIRKGCSLQIEDIAGT